MIILSKNPAKFKLTKDDFEITWFSGSGAGGQYRNKHANCCRMTHKESGITKIGQSQRDQISNRQDAFKAICDDPKFKSWLEKKLIEIEEGVTLEQKVDELMAEENIVTEVKVNGKWEEVKTSDLQF